MERSRSMREDHLVHAGLIVNIAKAVEAGDQTKIKRMTELQMLAALRCTVNYSDISWWKSLQVLPAESGIRLIWMPPIADHVSKHPEIKLTDEEQSLILVYLRKGYDFEEKKPGQPEAAAPRP